MNYKQTSSVIYVIVVFTVKYNTVRRKGYFLWSPLCLWVQFSQIMPPCQSCTKVNLKFSVFCFCLFFFSSGTTMRSTSWSPGLKPSSSTCWRTVTWTNESLHSGLYWGKTHTTNAGEIWSCTWKYRWSTLFIFMNVKCLFIYSWTCVWYITPCPLTVSRW